MAESEECMQQGFVYCNNALSATDSDVQGYCVESRGLGADGRGGVREIEISVRTAPENSSGRKNLEQ